MFRPLLRHALATALLVGCSSSVSPLDVPPAAADVVDVSSPPVDVFTLDAGAPDRSAPLDAPPPDRGPPPSVLCAGVPCPAGAACCLATGRCFDPASGRDACPTPAQSGGDVTCASNLDCPAGSFCAAAAGASCVGPGRCIPRDNCGSCSGSGDGCQVCGCDGMTYPSVQSACLAGVRTAGSTGACGVPQTNVPYPGADAGPRGFPTRIPCATSAQCPGAQQCCPLTGVCFDAACPGCCRTPPAGTDFPCTSDAECYPTQYCRGEGCGTPGGCAVIRNAGCSGAVAQVCGCNGRTYINECWATSEGIRVAAPGPCTAP
jgi:hypothetical protein